MKPQRPSFKRAFRRMPPQWNAALWYLPLMLLLRWLWQGALSQFSVHPISSSEFKSYLKHGEVLECAVQHLHR